MDAEPMDTDSVASDHSALTVDMEGNIPPREVVIYGDYEGCLEDLVGDASNYPVLTLLASSDEDYNSEHPQVRVYCVGADKHQKYWEKEGSDVHAEKVADGRWFPQVIADELFERICDDGENSVPAAHFIEESFTEYQDRLLIVSVPLFYRKVDSLRRILKSRVERSKKALGLFYHRFVKPRSTKNIVKAFLEISTSPDVTQSTSLEALAAKLREGTVVASARDMLQRIIRLINWGWSDDPVITGTFDANIFLAAYKITSWPDKLFMDRGEAEEKLILASRQMLDAFNASVAALEEGQSYASIRTNIAIELPSFLVDHFKAFHEWTRIDKPKCLQRLQDALRGLERAEASLPDNENSSLDRMRLRVRRHELKKRISQMTGAVPVQSGPQRTGGGLSNLQLVHEMMLDKDFLIEDYAEFGSGKPVRTTARTTFVRDFWDNLTSDLVAAPQAYGRVLSVLSEVKTGMEAVFHGQPDEALVRQVIDMDEITAELNHGGLDYEKSMIIIDGIIGLLVSMHDRIQLPIRSAETRQKWATLRSTMQCAPDEVALACALCMALELVAHRVHVVRVDMANRRLRAIMPRVRLEGVDYLRRHFDANIASGRTTLERTTEWIGNTLRELGNDDRVNMGELLNGSPEGFARVLYIAAINLIAEKDVANSVPETMMLDRARITGFRAFFRTNVVSSIILVTTQLQCVQNIPDTAVRSEALRVVQDIVVKHPPSPVGHGDTIRRVIEALEEKMDGAGLEVCRSTMEKNLQNDSSVDMAMTKIFKRVLYHLTRKEDVPASCNVPEYTRVLFPQIQTYSKMIGEVVLLTKKVHVVHYNRIIREAVDKIMAGY